MTDTWRARTDTGIIRRDDRPLHYPDGEGGAGQPSAIDRHREARKAPASESLLEEVAAYYSGRLREFGETPRGVDWNGEASQQLRFEQLSRIVTDPHTPCTITDLGCGYGAMFEFLKTRVKLQGFLGVDVSADMIEAARQRHARHPNARFIADSAPDSVSDYCVASGIFNVRLTRSDAEWQRHLLETIDVLDRGSTRGFAFNCLTSYSDADRMRSDLYYADPCQLFDLCKRRYARQVALLHDYGLYEFTILVRKPA